MAELYASRRGDLRLLEVDEAFIGSMIAMQQKIQMQGMEQSFPDAQHLIIAEPDQSIGRVVIDFGVTDIRLIDIAIMPSRQRQGIGRAVLAALQAMAMQKDLGMSLAVESTNIPARNLYFDMGFVTHSVDAIFEQMHWRDAMKETSQACLC
ncbi:GNAT family N-acetyltransferase [Undibacterium sp. SXout7W]|uniref:GNAT family N-acetyltransferase n=1 Tax=Undibacterium sp. SXout7W TaxID=3413049 RepID=UPI003BF21DB2